MSLPDQLRPLLPDGDQDRRLSVELPPGRVVPHDGRPALWLSDGPAPAGLWARLRAEHATSGLWPLLVSGHFSDASRPWESGELFLVSSSSPAAHDPGQLLAGWWRGLVSEPDATVAPYGPDWPGLAAAAARTSDPDGEADSLAAALESVEPDASQFAGIIEALQSSGLDLTPGSPAAAALAHMDLAHMEQSTKARDRLALVPAARGADALANLGWSGAVNHIGDAGELAAVLRYWEDSRGARLVGAGFDTIWLSIAAPPQTIDEALAVAAEHFAFCPDNIWQGNEPYTLAAYADELVGATRWQFWWD